MAVPGIHGGSHGLQNPLNHVPIVWLYQHTRGQPFLGRGSASDQILTGADTPEDLAPFTPCRWRSQGQGSNTPQAEVPH